MTNNPQSIVDNPKSIFVNTLVDPETFEMLSTMAKEDGFENSRGAFVRKLIRQEYKRRLAIERVSITPAGQEALKKLEAGEPE